MKELILKIKPVKEEEGEYIEERKPRFQRYLTLKDNKEDSLLKNKVLKSKSLEPNQEIIEENFEEDRKLLLRHFP